MDADFLSARNTLTQRTFGPECSGTVAIDVSSMKDGDYAGLGLLQKKYGFVGVKMVGGTRAIRSGGGGGCLVLIQRLVCSSSSRTAISAATR